mgnify:CR=1 FL=1
MLYGGHQPLKKRPEDMPVPSVPTMPDVYINKALDKGLGVPPIKEPYISTANYGAKCMLIGYKAGKKATKKRYKKKIKLLNQKLKAVKNKPIEYPEES